MLQQANHFNLNSKMTWSKIKEIHMFILFYSWTESQGSC